MCTLMVQVAVFSKKLTAGINLKKSHRYRWPDISLARNIPATLALKIYFCLLKASKPNKLSTRKPKLPPDLDSGFG